MSEDVAFCGDLTWKLQCTTNLSYRHIKIQIYFLVDELLNSDSFLQFVVSLLHVGELLSFIFMVNELEKTTPSPLPHYYVDLYKRGLPFPYVQLDIRVP